MNYGTLHGVGVGPGAPDLLTLRAVETLKRADVLALPRSSDYGSSMAWKIIEPIIGKISGQERLFLTFPMSKEPARLRRAWDAAFAKIGEHLERGRSVAFATEGDPSLYSTFVYLRREAPVRWPGIRVEVVPGVSSITAVPAVIGAPLADGLERIAIIPANYGVDDLVAILNTFDTTILMKIGSEMPKVVAALERTGLIAKAVYVAKATMREQRIVTNLREVQTERGDCFAMVIVTRGERRGVLAGDVSSAAQLAKVGA
jgi:precorrin-2/cobalt-factor-2 C20-methyltransferase